MKVDSKKEGRYLVFEFEGERGGTVKYDLATNQYIGKKGKPVSNLCSQFRGYSINNIIDSFEDEKYKKFLRHVHEKTSQFSHYTNVGTFLTKIADYSYLEQFFSAGITNVDLGSRYTISQVPKGVIKMCRENPTTMPLRANLINNYNSKTDLCNIIYSMKDEMQMFKCTELLYGYLGSRYSSSSLEKVVALVEKFNYKPQSLLKYVDNIMVFEGANSYTDVITYLYDYAVMSKRMSPKYEKYPKYLKTVHDITVRNYNRLKEEFDEKAFQERINKDMEFTYKGYAFIYPSSTKDIKDEAVQQSNCVASYIKRVIDGECHIMFMRYKDSTDKSLVTLEISDYSNKVVQERGRYNRDTTQEEKEAIEKFNKHLEKLNEEKGDK